jgi:RNA polymerase-binding transcription factor DksA
MQRDDAPRERIDLGQGFWPEFMRVIINFGGCAMKNVANYKAALLKRLSELDSRLHAIEAELDVPHSKDWEESAVEREGDEVLEALGQAGQAEIQGIQAALQRIRDGEYGFCAKCGEEISPERLSVLPATPLCRNCAA